MHVKCFKRFFLSTRDERIPNTVGQMAGVCCSQRLLKAQSFTVAAADFIQPDKQTLKNKRKKKKVLIALETKHESVSHTS